MATLHLYRTFLSVIYWTILNLPKPSTLVRILYTLNNAPQYILARSSHPVDVNVLHTPTHESPGGRVIGKTSLRNCIDAICASRYALCWSVNSRVTQRHNKTVLPAQKLFQPLIEISRYTYLTLSRHQHLHQLPSLHLQPLKVLLSDSAFLVGLCRTLEPRRLMVHFGGVRVQKHQRHWKSFLRYERYTRYFSILL